MYKVKICGILEAQHLEAALKSGAAYVGFVFFENSRRNLAIKTAKELAKKVPKDVVKVALMVNPSDMFLERILENVSIDMLQLHGEETIRRVHKIKRLSNLKIMKAIGVSNKEDLALVNEYSTVADQILLDAKPPKGSKAPGGLGKSFDWDILSEFQCKKPWLLAGGLTAKNVYTAIKKTGACQLDVSSGVEDKFGIKSEKKISEFLNVVRGAQNA